MTVDNDFIAGFQGSFDYQTISGLVEHLREFALRRCGGRTSEANYDPEGFSLITDAAEALEKLKISRNYEKECAITAASEATKLGFKISDLEEEIGRLRRGNA